MHQTKNPIVLFQNFVNHIFMVLLFLLPLAMILSAIISGESLILLYILAFLLFIIWIVFNLTMKAAEHLTNLTYTICRLGIGSFLLSFLQKPKTKLTEIVMHKTPYSNLPLSDNETILEQQLADPKVRIHLPPQTLRAADRHIAQQNKWRVAQRIKGTAPNDEVSDYLNEPSKKQHQ